MKENIEELRANVERTEMAGLLMVGARVACARAALDYIAQLEQTSRAQRTAITESADLQALFASQSKGEPAARALEVPNGALHNGAVYADMLENIYDDRCAKLALRNCSEWIELRRCLTAIREYFDSPLAAKAGKVPEGLTANNVEWIVNDNAELGVKIGNQFFFLYKGDSLVYESGRHDNGEPMMYRRVFKREFGECCHPVNYDDPAKWGTVSLDDSEEWKPIAASLAAPLAEAVPAEESMSGAQMDDVVDNLREYASNAGYSHNDYQDTMRQAANVIEHLRASFFHYLPGHLAPAEPAPILPSAEDGWPGEIYLQAGDDPLGHFSEYDEVSWCDHPQGESDVRYVRADIATHAQAPAERDAILEEAARAAEKCYGHVGQPDDPHPEAVVHNGAVNDCAFAIRALKSHPSASPDALKGGEA